MCAWYVYDKSLGFPARLIGFGVVGGLHKRVKKIVILVVQVKHVQKSTHFITYNLIVQENQQP